MALNGRKVWGAWANRCKVCSKVFLARRSNAIYCSADCRREGIGRIKRMWSRVHYLKHEMDPKRLTERIEAIAMLPGFGTRIPGSRMALARRMMAYA